MPPRPADIAERLHDIIKWGNALARHIAEMDRDEFLRDEKTQHAVMKCIEAVGEAAKEILKTDSTFDARYPDLKLKAAARMRDRLTHSYRDIDLGLVWATATLAVPKTVSAAALIAKRINTQTD